MSTLILGAALRYRSRVRVCLTSGCQLSVGHNPLCGVYARDYANVVDRRNSVRMACFQTGDAVRRQRVTRCWYFPWPRSENLGLILEIVPWHLGQPCPIRVSDTERGKPPHGKSSAVCACSHTDTEAYTYTYLQPDTSCSN